MAANGMEIEGEADEEYEDDDDDEGADFGGDYQGAAASGKNRNRGGGGGGKQRMHIEQEEEEEEEDLTIGTCLGCKWKVFGTTRPTTGIELVHSELKNALYEKLQEQKEAPDIELGFNQATFESFGLPSSLSREDFIRVGDLWYRPDAGEEEVEQLPIAIDEESKKAIEALLAEEAQETTRVRGDAGYNRESNTLVDSRALRRLMRGGAAGPAAPQPKVKRERKRQRRRRRRRSNRRLRHPRLCCCGDGGGTGCGRFLKAAQDADAMAVEKTAGAVLPGLDPDPAPAAAAAGDSPPKRKRGRPPKIKKVVPAEEEEEPPAASAPPPSDNTPATADVAEVEKEAAAAKEAAPEESPPAAVAPEAPKTKKFRIGRKKSVDPSAAAAPSGATAAAAQPNAAAIGATNGGPGFSSGAAPAIGSSASLPPFPKPKESLSQFLGTAPAADPAAAARLRYLREEQGLPPPRSGFSSAPLADPPAGLPPPIHQRPPAAIQQPPPQQPQQPQPAQMKQPSPGTPPIPEPTKGPPPSEEESKNSEVITFYIGQLDKRMDILVHKHEQCTVEKEAMNRDMGSQFQQLQRQIYESNQMVYPPNMQYEMQQHQWMLQQQLTQCQNEWSAQADMYKKQEAEVTQQIHQCRNTLKVLKQLQTAGLALQSSPAMVADFGSFHPGMTFLEQVLQQVRTITGVKTMPSSSSNNSRNGNNAPNTPEGGGGGACHASHCVRLSR